MAVFKRDMTFNELFIIPIRGLYADCSISIDEFKERNSALLKDKWVDTSHGENGEKIYQLFDTTSEGDLVKESLQEWLCDNRNEMTNCISITLRNHEMTYADWFPVCGSEIWSRRISIVQSFQKTRCAYGRV